MATEALKQTIEELQQKLKETERELQKKQETSQTIVVHTSSEKKLPRFNENDNIEEWCDLATNHPSLKKLKLEKEKVDFILDHLTDNPKRELRFQIDRTKASSQEVFKVLQEIYGSKKTFLQLQQEFFTSQQGDNTIETFAHLLMEQFLQLQKKDIAVYKDTDAILKERFAEGLREVSLKREMRRLNREQPSLKFHELRDLAKTWQKDLGEQHATSETILTLQQTVLQQQKQLDTLTQNMKQTSQIKKEDTDNLIQHQQYSNHGFRGRGQGRGRGRGYNHGIQSHRHHNPHFVHNQTHPHNYQTTRFNSYHPQHQTSQPSSSHLNLHRPTGPIYCHYCHQPNHIARDCFLRKTQYMSVNSDTNSKEPNRQTSNIRRS